MKITWTNEATRDLGRIRRFLAGVNPRAARHTFETLRYAPRKLLDYPRLGVRLEHFPDRTIRRMVVGDYEIRYELKTDLIVILRVWHGKEDR